MDAPKHLRRVLGLNKPDLQIRPCRNLAIAGGKVLRRLRDSAKLKRPNCSAGDTQPRHESILNGGQIEQAVPFESEDLLLVRRFVCPRVFKESIIRIEGMLFVLDPLFGDERNFLFVLLIRGIRRGVLIIGQKSAKTTARCCMPAKKPVK